MMFRFPRILTPVHLLGHDRDRWSRRWADGMPFARHRPYLVADVWRPRQAWVCLGVVVPAVSPLWRRRRKGRR